MWTGSESHQIKCSLGAETENQILASEAKSSTRIRFGPPERLRFTASQDIKLRRRGPATRRLLIRRHPTHFFESILMMKFGISQPVTRKEDERFLTGNGRYIDDATPENALFAQFVYSPIAHGKILAINVDEAKSSGGVHAVLTARDL